jgi:hypothetical protein
MRWIYKNDTWTYKEKEIYKMDKAFLNNMKLYIGESQLNKKIYIWSDSSESNTSIFINPTFLYIGLEVLYLNEKLSQNRIVKWT